MSGRTPFGSPHAGHYDGGTGGCGTDRQNREGGCRPAGDVEGTRDRKRADSTDTATSTKDVTETAEADEASTGPTAASAPEPSASASTSASAKPTVRPATPRPVVRGSLGVGEQLRDLPHRGNGGHSTTRTAPAGDGAATVGPSSIASSPAASSSTGSNSSGGDAGGS